MKCNSRDSNTKRTRTIVLELLRLHDKTKKSKQTNTNKLKYIYIFINNDFSKATLELRKDLMVEVKKAK